MAGTVTVQASNRLLQGELRRIEIERARGDACLRRGHLREHSVDVDAAVGRGERREPPRRLLELAPRGDRPPAAGLVPGDGDVDEPLEEVTLRCVRRPPRVLERLVGGEVVPPADQVEPELEALGDGVRARP